MQRHSSRIPTEGFRKRYEPLAERAGQLEGELARTLGELDCFRAELLSEEQALHEAQQLLSNLEGLDEQTKRQALQVLVREIEVGGEEVILRLKYQPFLSLELPKSLRAVEAAA